jgi:hypothetical protein
LSSYSAAQGLFSTESLTAGLANGYATMERRAEMLNAVVTGHDTASGPILPSSLYREACAQISRNRQNAEDLGKSTCRALSETKQCRSTWLQVGSASNCQMAGWEAVAPVLRAAMLDTEARGDADAAARLSSAVEVAEACFQDSLLGFQRAGVQDFLVLKRDCEPGIKTAGVSAYSSVMQQEGVWDVSPFALPAVLRSASNAVDNALRRQEDFSRGARDSGGPARDGRDPPGRLGKRVP